MSSGSEFGGRIPDPGVQAASASSADTIASVGCEARIISCQSLMSSWKDTVPWSVVCRGLHPLFEVVSCRSDRLDARRGHPIVRWTFLDLSSEAFTAGLAQSSWAGRVLLATSSINEERTKKETGRSTVEKTSDSESWTKHRLIDVVRPATSDEAARNVQHLHRSVST